jgi:DNA-binding response OmpR family regulator
MSYKLLLAEDDFDLGQLLSEYLTHHEYEVKWVTAGQQVWQCLVTEQHDLLLLDVMMPGEDGFSIAEKIKIIYPRMPFLFITARKMKPDILHGLKLGAEDYISKPFDPDELVLRIKNILKRADSTGNKEVAVIQLGIYNFYPNDLLLTTPETDDILTEKETKLLHFLFEHKDGLIKRTDILNHLWEEADFFKGRSLDVFITRLRKRLSRDSRIEIQSIRGIGFRVNFP